MLADAEEAVWAGFWCFDTGFAGIIWALRGLGMGLDGGVRCCGGAGATGAGGGTGSCKVGAAGRGSGAVSAIGSDAGSGEVSGSGGKAGGRAGSDTGVTAMSIGGDSGKGGTIPRHVSQHSDSPARPSPWSVSAVRQGMKNDGRIILGVPFPTVCQSQQNPIGQAQRGVASLHPAVAEEEFEPRRLLLHPLCHVLDLGLSGRSQKRPGEGASWRLPSPAWPLSPTAAPCV